MSVVDPFPTPDLLVYGLALQTAIEEWTGTPCGFIDAPHQAQGSNPVQLWHVVHPMPGEVTAGRPFVKRSSGALFHYDVETVGKTDVQVAAAQAKLVDAVTGLTAERTLLNEWVGDLPAPAHREVVGYGPPGKSEERGIRWSSVEFVLPVLG